VVYIELDYTINSNFINELLKTEQAKLFLIVQSIDNKFFEIKLEERNKIINKNRLSLSKKTQIQLMVKSCNRISFENNNEICGLYEELKSEIVVPANSVLAFSNVVTFNESSKKGLELFEKRVDPNIKSEIKIEEYRVFFHFITYSFSFKNDFKTSIDFSELVILFLISFTSCDLSFKSFNFSSYCLSNSDALYVTLPVVPIATPIIIPVIITNVMDNFLNNDPLFSINLHLLITLRAWS